MNDITIKEKQKNIPILEEKLLLGRSNYSIQESEGKSSTGSGPHFIFFNEEEPSSEDFYYELNSKDIVKYQEILSLLKEQTMNRTGLGTPTLFSTFSEWSKQIQRCGISSDKMIDNHSRHKNIILDVYRTLLNLRERNWYEEVIQLYKVRK